MITISHLTKIFEGKGPRVTALEDVNLEIGKGDIYGIIGMSGAGKSTLLRCLTLLERPTSGQIMLAGQDIASLSGAQLLAARRGMGVVFQGYNLLMQKTVAENVAFPLRLEKGYDKAAVQARVAELLAIVGLEDRAGAYPAQLSGGQKTRVHLAKLLLSKPDILLLDEPTNHLDIAAIEWLEDFLRSYPGAVLIISHDRYFLDRIVTKVIEIENKKSTVYNGNYSFFWQQKEINREMQQKAYEMQQKEIKHQEDVIRTLRSFNREKSIKRAESREKVTGSVPK